MQRSVLSVDGSIRQTEEVSEGNDFRKAARRGASGGPAGCAAARGGGSRWCREVSGSGREDEHHLSNSTPVRCQSHTGSKRPFIPQPCTIDLFIPAPSLSLTISASRYFTPIPLPPALLLCLAPPLSNRSYCALSLLLSRAVTGDWEIHTVYTRTQVKPYTIYFFYLLSHESSAVIVSP